MVVLSVALGGFNAVLFLFVIQIPHLLAKFLRLGFVPSNFVAQFCLLIVKKRKFIVVNSRKVFLINNVLVQQVTLTHLALNVFLELFAFFACFNKNLILFLEGILNFILFITRLSDFFFKVLQHPLVYFQLAMNFLEVFLCFNYFVSNLLLMSLLVINCTVIARVVGRRLVVKFLGLI